MSSSAAPELGGPAGLGVGFQVTSGLHLKPPMFSVAEARLCSQPDKEDRLPRGPGGRQAGPVWLVPTGKRGQESLRPKTRPSLRSYFPGEPWTPSPPVSAS